MGPDRCCLGVYIHLWKINATARRASKAINLHFTSKSITSENMPINWMRYAGKPAISTDLGSVDFRIRGSWTCGGGHVNPLKATGCLQRVFWWPAEAAFDNPQPPWASECPFWAEKPDFQYTMENQEWCFSDQKGEFWGPQKTLPGPLKSKHNSG